MSFHFQGSIYRTETSGDLLFPNIQQTINVAIIYGSKQNIPFYVSQGRIKKNNKKIWIYPYLGGWLGQERANIHKKNIPLKSILSHFRSNFFPFQGGGQVRPGTDSSSTICLHLLLQPTSHYCQSLTPTALCKSSLVGAQRRTFLNFLLIFYT